MKLVISYNEKILKEKSDGNYITAFKPKEFDLSSEADKQELKELLRTNIYSTNYWQGSSNNKTIPTGYLGHAGKANYAGMFGFCLDFDDGKLKIDQAKNIFKDYHFVLHTTSGHMQDRPLHHGVQPRFRILLPFKLEVENNKSLPVFLNADYAQEVFDLLKQRFPDSDPGVWDLGRKFFPFLGESFNYIFEVNIGKDYYNVSNKDIELFREYKNYKQPAPSKTKNYITKDLEVFLADKKTKKSLSDLKSGQSIYCPFCDDINSQSPSGQFNIDKHGNFNIYCHHQKQTFFEKRIKWDPLIDQTMFFDVLKGYPAYINPTNPTEPIYLKSEQNIKNFCLIHNVEREYIDVVPRAIKMFNPKLPTGYSIEEGDMEGKYNTFFASKLLHSYKDIQNRIKNKEQIPFNIAGLKIHTPILYKVLLNFLGNDTNIKNFVTWLAYIIQYREIPFTYWLIQTSQGAGKNLFTTTILRPIFGDKAVDNATNNELTSQFNLADEQTWIKVYDEIFSSDKKNNEKIMNTIKNKTGDARQRIQGKGLDSRAVISYMALLLFTNYSLSVLESDDRRTNVIDTRFTAEKLPDTDWWPGGEKAVELLLAEAPAFAEFIQRVEVDPSVREVAFDTPERRKLIDNSKSDLESILDAIDKKEIELLDLDEAFPSNAYDVNDFNATARTEIIEAVIQYSAIPAKYAIEFYRAASTYENSRPSTIRKKLRAAGVETDYQIYDPTTKTNKKYYKRTEKRKGT